MIIPPIKSQGIKTKLEPWINELVLSSGAGTDCGWIEPFFGTGNDEKSLYEALSKTKAKFIMSTWHHNDFRENSMLKRYWGDFNVSTREHFYHTGGRIENRHSMVEALVYNFDLVESIKTQSVRQLELFAATA